MTEEGCNIYKPKKRLSLRLALGLAAQVAIDPTSLGIALMSVKSAIIFSSPFELGYSEWKMSSSVVSTQLSLSALLGRALKVYKRRGSRY